MNSVGPCDGSKARDPSVRIDELRDRHSDLPAAMQGARRWLVYRLEPNATPGKKPSKVPYYLNGRRRGTLDTPEDVASFGTFEQALRVLATDRYSGLGFALGPDGTGQYWQGVDLDGTTTRPELALIADDLPGYTEDSPSGSGRHAMGYGRRVSVLGPNSSGIEAYSEKRFFTVTGEKAGVGNVVCLADFIEQVLAPRHGRESLPAAPLLANACPVQVNNQTIIDLRSALNSLPSDNRAEWIKFGHALKNLGDIGRGLWLDWSTTSTKFDLADAARVWTSFKPTQTGYQAVFAAAQAAGWQNPRSKAARSGQAVVNAGDQFDLFLRDKGGNIRPLYANVIAILRSKGAEFELKFDEFSRRHFCRGKCLTDGDIREISEWVQRHGVTPAVSVISEAIIRKAEEASFHPVKMYLGSLIWDSKPRLDKFLIEYAGAEDTTLIRAQTRKFMIQAVSRIYDPGCQADATIVLEGEQGVGKSSLLRTLFGPEWFTDHLPEIGSKDSMMQLSGAWCIEIAELASLARADAARIKQFLTSRCDRYRGPYGRVVSESPRSCVFAGTVNPGAGGYLKDETGGRRFWPIKVSRKIDMNVIEAERDQLWAEAVAAYNASEVWHLEEAELIAEADAVQAERYVGDPWLGLIQEYVESKDEVTLEQLFKGALYLTEIGRWSQSDKNRVSLCLSALKWKRIQKRVAGEKGKRVSMYVRGNADAYVSN